MTTPPQPRTVTIAIPTFNGDEYLAEVLEACLHQKTDFIFEVLVIDSGSTDRTLDIVGRDPRVRLVEIPNCEFGHGRTRNLAVNSARGDIVAFLTQDATPADPAWLQELVGPFEDASVAGVFGKQIPRSGCCPPVKRDVREAFLRPRPGFFSNVNSAVRRSVAEEVPFRDVSYAEDLAFADDAVTAGYRIMYAPGAAVLHSHDLSIPDYFRRMYDEARGVRQSGGRRHRRPRVLWLIAATVRGTVKDWWFVVTDKDRQGPLAGWLLKVPIYNASRRLAIWLANRDRLPGTLEQRLSLDARRRRGAPKPA